MFIYEKIEKMKCLQNHKYLFQLLSKVDNLSINMKPAFTPQLYHPFGQPAYPLFYTPSGLAGTVEEFKRRCQKHPGLVELERMARLSLGNWMFTQHFPTPIRYTNIEDFDDEYGKIGGSRAQQQMYLMQVPIPSEYIGGISTPLYGDFIKVEKVKKVKKVKKFQQLSDEE